MTQPEMPAIHILIEDEAADQRTYDEATRKLRDLIRAGRDTRINLGPIVPLTQSATGLHIKETA